jgi:hypothetical protein
MYNIAAADTVLSRPSLDALEEVFPGTPVRGDVTDTGSLISIEWARTVLGFGAGAPVAGRAAPRLRRLTVQPASARQALMPPRDGTAA